MKITTNIQMTKIGFISFFFIWQQRPISELSRSSLCDSYTNLFIQGRLPPEVNRILYVKLVPKVTFDTCRNLPYKITNEEIYDIFGKYGDIRQIRVQESNFDFLGLLSSGETKETRGTAFVVYEDIYDAKDAVEHLSGFNVGGRYLVVLYFQATKCGFLV